MGKSRYDYFEAFEQIVGYACDEAQALERVVMNFDPSTVFEEMNSMHVIENNADHVNHAIYKNLIDEFITVIERDDILLLAQCLDDIVDSIEDVLMTMYMYDVKEIFAPAIEIVSLIGKSTNALRIAMMDFRNFKKSPTLQTLLVDVSDYEEAADKKYVEAIRTLHVKYSHDPMYVMVWESLVRLMEKCCDKCAHAGDVMSTVIMKNS